MEGTEEQHTIKELMEQNRALLEELTQCKADKDFVWNLWRRLQSSQPEVTSVISMVIAREKEKSELKDKKVLEILQMKDEKIKELKEQLLSAGDDAQYSKARYHDLLIENEELKEQLDKRHSEFAAKEKEGIEEISYLSNLLKAHQAQKEIDDENSKGNRNRLEQENNELKIQISTLERHVVELKEEKLGMATAIEANANLEEKIKSLENEVNELTAKSVDIANKYEEAESKLKEDKVVIDEQLSSLKEKSETISQLENNVISLNRELEQSQESYRHASMQLAERARDILQLQELHNDNQKASVDREQQHRRELATLQKAVADLQARCYVCQEREQKLQTDIERLEENTRTQLEELGVKEIIIKELKDALKDRIQSTDLSGLDDSFGDARVGNGKPRTPEDNAKEGAKEVMEGDGEGNTQFRKHSSDSTLGNTTSQENLRSRFERVGVLHEMETKLSHCRKTVDELKRLLELKDAELVETKRAHSQRQQRYRMLKENYQLVLEQLKTYETLGAEEEKSEPIERPDEKELRHLSSDQVWKELAYFKHEYEILAKERHDVLEELDILRVQHANNVASTQELRVCLSEEKEQNAELLTKIEAEQEAVSDGRREVEKLEYHVGSWQEKALQGQTIANEFDEENQLLKQEIKVLRERNEALSKELHRLTDELETFKRKYDTELTKEREEVQKATDRLQEEELLAEVEKDTNIDRLGDELTKQQLESLSTYDAQVRRIADRILSSSPKSKEGSVSPARITQATQTRIVPRFVDSGINVNLDSENMSSMDDEESFNVTTSAKKIKVSKGGGNGRKIVQRTPLTKKVIKNTPGRNEWASMKQRILSLTQEVSALRLSKDKAVKAVNEHKQNYESLQAEYNNLLQKLQLSRNSVQRLTDALKQNQKEKDMMMIQLNERSQLQANVLSISDWKHLEEQLRMATTECTRLSSSVRKLGSENEQLRARLKEMQDNTSRMEHVIAQKKILVDEVKSKMKDMEEKLKTDSEAAKGVEEKLSQLKEREKANKVRIETLEHRLEGEAREKQKYHQQLLNCQDQLKKKSQQLTKSQTLRNQAKIVVSEMEAAATMQLHGLANQSEATITSLHRKLDQAQERSEEFQAFVRTLVEELLRSMRNVRSRLQQLQEKHWRDASKVAVQQAQTKACSILNLSSAELEEIMEGRDAHKEEAKLKTQQEKAWMAEIDSCLKRQKSFAVPLLEVFLDLVDEKIAGEVRLLSR